MKFATKRIAGNLLFAADIFILFLVLFESRMHIPAWLQSVGRMHPMFLHFPIVILLLAMGMEFFRFRPDLSIQPFYQDFTDVMLLTGAVSAAITVIMGLLLSNESGYTGSTVQWHKWTGLAIVLFASVIYWSRNSTWYKLRVAKTGAVLAVISIVITGHLGAGITHGEDFISTPLIAARAAIKVPVEKAVIYADVVQPIFTAKCMSCHNSEKAKGQLILDNPEDIKKGGKNGQPFVSQHADSSLIIQRINLPEEEKKHMPLTGKPQLTKDEVDIIYRWIQSGADFKKKLIELPVTDSLRITASKYLAPPEEEKYDFASANEKTVKGLSNNYRVVYPLAIESPALVVDFYNKKQYSSKSLEDLLAVKKQIVELNLNKMPVSNADLKVVGQMENLRTLNLAFTNISAEGLGQLSSLKFLKSLSLSGNKIDKSAISSIGKIKSLREVFVWDTGLTGEEVTQWQKSDRQVQFMQGYKQAAPMALNDPILVYNKSVFTDSMHITLRHPIPGAQIRYSLDSTGPDSSTSPIYHDFVALDKNTFFKARAFKEGWLGSDTITHNFYKSAFKPDSISFISLPDDSYKGDGPLTLSDHITGNFDTGDGKWLGFRKDMTILLRFKTPVKLRSVALHLVKNSGADIYPPVQVAVWGGMDEGHLRLLKTVSPKPLAKGESAAIFLQDCTFSPASVRFIKIMATNLKKPPKWGNSPKKPGWVFMDEVLLN